MMLPRHYRYRFAPFLLCVKVIGCHEEFKRHLWLDLEIWYLGLLTVSELKLVVEVLADLLEDDARNIREVNLSRGLNKHS